LRGAILEKRKNFRFAYLFTTVILVGYITGCIYYPTDETDEREEQENKYGVQLIEINIHNPKNLNYSIIVPIAQSGKYEEPEINSNLTVLKGNAILSIVPTEYGLSPTGLLINSSETLCIKAEATEYVSIYPTMLNKTGYWFFLNCSNTILISYRLYSYASVHSSINHFWIDDYELNRGWSVVVLNSTMMME